MDVCHLLLERPWQFDQRTLHNVYRNTFSFTKDGINVALGSSKLVGMSKPTKDEGKNLLSRTKILWEVKNPTLSLCSWSFRRKWICYESPPQSTTLKRVCRCCPWWHTSLTMRDIHHYINFFPGSSIPNKATYWMSLEDHIEMQKQVKELINKGLV